jgi:hypothetical protein
MSEASEHVVALGVEGLLASVLQKLERDLVMSGKLKVMAVGTRDLDVWSREEDDPAQQIFGEGHASATGFPRDTAPG